MKRSLKRNVLSVFVGGMALLALAALGIGSIPWISHAAEEAKEEKAEPEKPKEEKATGGEICCKEGDTTPPNELAEKVPPGELHSPYQDYAKLAKDDPDLVKEVPSAWVQRVSRRHRWRRLLPGLDSRRLVLGQHRRRSVQARDARIGGAREARLRSLSIWQRARAHAADGFQRQDLGRSLENHCLHSFDQSAWRQSS